MAVAKTLPTLLYAGSSSVSSKLGDISFERWKMACDEKLLGIPDEVKRFGGPVADTGLVKAVVPVP